MAFAKCDQCYEIDMYLIVILGVRFYSKQGSADSFYYVWHTAVFHTICIIIEDRCFSLYVYL